MRGYILGFLGNLYLKSFNLEKAIICYEKALKYNTKNVLAIYNYSIVLLQKGEFQKALSLLEKSRSINKKVLYEKLIILGIASCYWKLDKINSAIDILEKLRKDYDYVSPEAMTTLSYLYMLNNENEKALKLAKDVLIDNPEYSSAWDNIGQIYFFKNDFKNAKENFLKAINFNKYAVDSLYYLGILEENENNFEKAKEYFEKASKCRLTSLNTITENDLAEKLNYYKNL